MRKKREPELVIIFELDEFKFCYNEAEDVVALVEHDDIVFTTRSQESNLRQGKLKFTLEEVLHFIPPVLDIAPLKISKTFTDKDDPYHWQQPFCTEMKALELHESLPIGTNAEKENRVICR